MFSCPLRPAPILLLILSCATHAQVLTLPGETDKFESSIDPMERSQLDFNFWLVHGGNPGSSNLEGAAGSVSLLDLKAPTKARNEFERGYKLLMRKDLPGAEAHLAKAIHLYPQFVSAYNALGSAYLSQNQNEQARSQFAQAVALDDHRPNSYLNQGCAELALKEYPAAEGSLRKASSLAPLDARLQLALVYAEFQNHDYAAVIEAARHEAARPADAGKHNGAAMIHFFAAGAWEAQGNLGEAQREIEILLKEDPNSPSAGQFRHVLQQLKEEQVKRAKNRSRPGLPDR